MRCAGRVVDFSHARDHRPSARSEVDAARPRVEDVVWLCPAVRAGVRGIVRAGVRGIVRGMSVHSATRPAAVAWSR